jgi:ABC-type branched-subunit amino acid transport system ATPase component
METALMAKILLKVDGISKSFGGLRAINNVTFNISAGQLLGLIGPNGAGKTTIFNLISGIYRVDTGHIVFDGTEITGWQPPRIARRGISRTFQVPRTFNSMSVEENLRVPAVLMGWSKSETEDRIAEALRSVNLIEQRHRDAAELSGGERQLLQFARSIVLEPKLLILDEPFGGASPGIIDLIITRTRDLVRSGMACLVISHDIVSLPRLCEDVVVLTDGAVLTHGALAAVREDARVIEAYLGS